MYTKPFDAFLKFLSFSAVCLLAACNSPSSNEDAKKQNEAPVTAPAAKAIFPGDSIPVFYMGRNNFYNQIRDNPPKGKFNNMNIVLVYYYNPKAASIGLSGWYFKSNDPKNEYDTSLVPAFLPKPGAKSNVKLTDSTYLSPTVLYAKNMPGSKSQVKQLVEKLDTLNAKYQWIVFVPVRKSNCGKSFLNWKISVSELEPQASELKTLSFEDLADFNPSPPYGLGEQ